MFEQYSHLPHMILSKWKDDLLCYLGVYDEIFQAIVKYKLLIQCMDVEFDPGPMFWKLLMGNFNQGHLMFAEAAGLQCCAVALYRIAFNALKSVRFWSAHTLDEIIMQGTNFYETLSTHWYLGVEDLPDTVNVLNDIIKIEYAFNSYGILSVEERDKAILEEHICCNSDNNGIILWLSEICISVIIDKQEFTNFVLTDPYSRNSEGIIYADGAAVILYFRSVRCLLNYLCSTYCSKSNSPVQYQIQFVKCLGTALLVNRKRKVVNEIISKCKKLRSQREQKRKELINETFSHRCKRLTLMREGIRQGQQKLDNEKEKSNMR